MAGLGIRGRLKHGIKRALGIEADSSTTPPNWQSRPSSPDAFDRASSPSASVVEDVPAPVAVAPLVEDAPATAEAAPAADAASDAEEASEAPASSSDAAPDDVVGPPLTMEAVQEILDDMVRPALQGDGGDISLIRIENNNIYVKLVGACSTCPSSIMTMKLGVEALLKEEFPSMNELVDVALAAPA